MFIAAIIAVFILVLIGSSYLVWKYDFVIGIYDFNIAPLVLATCITFLLVYYNII